MPQCKIPVFSLGPAAADNFSYLVNHLQSQSWAFSSFYCVLMFCSAASFVLLLSSHTLPGLPAKNTPRSPESPEAEPNDMPEKKQWWIDEKLLWSCPTWIIVLSVDNPLFVSSWHPTKSVSPTKKSEGRLMEDDEVSGRRGMWGPRFPPLLGKEHTWRECCALSLSLSLPDMKNENYKGDNNKNSRMSGQAGAVHYSQLLWAAW